MDNPGKFLPLTESTYLILVALSEPRHGYAVMQRVSEASGNTVRIGPGTLYGAFSKLVEQHLIIRAGESESEGERRKLYTLTPLGREVVDAETARLEGLARMGRRLLNGNGESA
jgi:DNA-binding PadR family transcriptional regulator